MRRAILILAIGLVAAVVVYCGVYLAGTATPRALLHSTQPELAWLQREFNLTDAEFSRISQLHAGYLPGCMERCRRINQLNNSLNHALTAATQVTPEIEKILSERAEWRATCQSEMVKHFFEVSRSMPSEQGKRYLEWVRVNTCLREQEMNHGTHRHAETTARESRP